MAAAAGFLEDTSERADLNQYWFSQDTIGAFADEIADCGGSAALVSSPSVFFSLPPAARAGSRVLDFDRQWEHDPGYVFYDFNAPLALPQELQGSFDFVLVDPPFITREVWEKYADTARWLLRPGGRLLCTTIAENAGMMEELLGLRPNVFRPSIPNLVYQYSVYTNYTSARLSAPNPEVDSEDWRPAAAARRGDDAPGGPIEIAAPTERALAAAGLGAEALADAACAAEAAAGLAGAAPAPPGAQLLADLRARLGALKRTLEAARMPVQHAVRRAGGTAGPPAEAALDAAAGAAKELRAWLEEHSAPLAEALGEEHLGAEDGEERWMVSAACDLVQAARESVWGGMGAEAYAEWAAACKEFSASIFRLSGEVLNRVKALKKESATVSTLQSSLVLEN